MALVSDVIELLSNNWDDFGYKTFFPVTCRLNGENIELPPLRLLIGDAHRSSTELDRIRKEGCESAWNKDPVLGVIGGPICAPFDRKNYGNRMSKASSTGFLSRKPGRE